MPEQHPEASKLHKAEEVFDVVFPSCGQSAEVLYPGKDPFHLPAASIAAQRTPVQGLTFTVDAIGRDHTAG